MNVDITRLKSGIDSNVLIDLDYSFTKEQLKNTNILELNNVKIKGKITNGIENYHLKLNIKGTMILPCSISLKPTKYPFSIDLDDEIDEFLEENIENNQNTIDIFPIIWENILMEIPLKVVNEDLSDVKKKAKAGNL